MSKPKKYYRLVVGKREPATKVGYYGRPHGSPKRTFARWPEVVLAAARWQRAGYEVHVFETKCNWKEVEI